MIIRGAGWAIACLALSTSTAGIAAIPADQTAQSANLDGSGEIVVVGDNGTSYRLTPDSLRDAAKAFLKYRSDYAPDSKLYFKVTLQDGETLDGISFVLRPRKNRAGSETIDLELDSDGRLSIPAEMLVKADWELRSNKPSGSIRVKPLVLSPGSEITDRRFGDIRLQCRVSVAFARIAGPLRLLVNTVSPCDNSSIALCTKAELPLKAATVDGYEKSLLFEDEPSSYCPPMHDKSISNDARMRLIYN